MTSPNPSGMSEIEKAREMARALSFTGPVRNDILADLLDRLADALEAAEKERDDCRLDFQRLRAAYALARLDGPS